MLIYYFGFPNHKITLLSLELLLWMYGLCQDSLFKKLQIKFMVTFQGKNPF